MTDQVQTTKGLIDRTSLTVKDIVTDGDNCRVTATEWYQGEEMVRRDVHVNILGPPRNPLPTKGKLR
jgi:hypothetical protein